MQDVSKRQSHDTWTLKDTSALEIANSPFYLLQVVTLTLPPATIDKYLIYNLAKKHKSLSLLFGWIHDPLLSLDRQIIYTMHRIPNPGQKDSLNTQVSVRKKKNFLEVHSKWTMECWVVHIQERHGIIYWPFSSYYVA